MAEGPVVLPAGAVDARNIHPIRASRVGEGDVESQAAQEAGAAALVAEAHPGAVEGPVLEDCAVGAIGWEPDDDPLGLGVEPPVPEGPPAGDAQGSIQAPAAGKVLPSSGGKLQGGAQPSTGVFVSPGQDKGEIAVHHVEAGAIQVADEDAILLQVVAQAPIWGSVPAAVVGAEQPMPGLEKLVRDAPAAMNNPEAQVEDARAEVQGEVARHLPLFAVQAGEGAAAPLEVRLEELAGHLQGQLARAIRQGLRKDSEPGHPVRPGGLLGP